MNKDTVVISRVKYDKLLHDSDFLEELRRRGVDNWDGYYDDDSESEEDIYGEDE
jgi:hypothetical protein